MPSKSKKQAKLMRAVAHGWKPSRIKGPTRAVAKEFVSADKRRDEVTGYQFGGGVSPYGGMMGRLPYRGIPPQRGQIQRGPTGGGPMGALRQAMQQRGGLHPGAQGPGGGFLSRFAQQTPGQPLHPGAQGPGGGGFLSRFRQMGGRPGGPATMYPNPGRQPGGGGRRTYGGRPTPGLHDVQDFSMGEGPGGRLEQEGLRRQAKMRGPGRFPGGGALSQAGGKPRPNIPGRRIAPPPNRYPGGGNPNLRGRNPMMRAARNRSGRGATSFLR